MKNTFVAAIMFAVLLAGCAPVATPLPPPAPVYEYRYEMVDTTEQCQPSSSEQGFALEDYFSYMSPEDFGGTVPVAIQEKTKRYPNLIYIENSRKVLDCVKNLLTDKLNQQTTNGWELVSLESLGSSTYDLGIEYTFIAIWRKEK